MRSGRQDDRGCECLGPKAESHRELPRNVLKFGRYHIEPDAAPGFFAFQDPSVAFEDPDPTPECRADPVDSSSPWERGVAPSESDLERPVRGVNRKSVPPFVVVDPARGAIRIDNQVDPMPAATDLVLSPVRKYAVVQQAEPGLD